MKSGVDENRVSGHARRGAADEECYPPPNLGDSNRDALGDAFG